MSPPATRSAPANANGSPDSVGGTRLVRLLTVTDLHQSRLLYAQLAEAVGLHRPDAVALVGDFLDCGNIDPDRLDLRACAEAIAALEVPEIILTRGNHEDWNYPAFSEVLAATGRTWTTLHGEAHAVGPLTVVGFPSLLGDETAFTLAKDPLPRGPGDWLSRIIRRLGPPSRAVWLMHEPPMGTPLSMPSGPIAGHPEWAEAIERFSPWVVVCGHDHSSPVRNNQWHHRLGQTLVVNVGQSNGEALHYALIEAAFDSHRPSLPRRLTVRGSPWTGSVSLP